jgi:hypothetical protein
LKKVNTPNLVVDETAPTVSLQQLKDGYKYETLNGTITVDAKKIGGTYKGQLQIDKIPSTGGGGIMDLDATAANVTITTKDEAGAVKVIKTDLSKITNFIDEKGNEYAIAKYGAGALGGAYYCFLKPTFSSSKITVFRAVVPSTSDYVIKKKGDDKGIKSTMLNSKKILVEYLSDCEILATKFKEVASAKAETPEKLAEQYSNCAIAK